MKKLLILALSVLVLTGCTNVSNKSLDELTNLMITSKAHLANIVFDGYKYYIPKGIKLIRKEDYNASLLDEKNNAYYLYIDVVSYYNKEPLNYEVNKTAYFSKGLASNDKNGYLEITKVGSGEFYFIEYMYNYGKIEAYVEEENIENAIINMSSILSSLEFNRNVLETTIGNEVLNYQESTYNVMKPKGNTVTNDIYLEYEEKYGMYEGYGQNTKEEDKIEIQED